MPTFGHTRTGRPVHAHTRDYLGHAHLRGIREDAKAVEGFNAKLALLITRGVGTMACAYLFCVIALASLPAILVTAGAIPSSSVPSFLIKPGLILIVAWVAQTFIQLVLLSIIMVGQSVQSAAADARAEKTFTDVETALDRLDTKTRGGLADVVAEIHALKSPARRPAGEKQTRSPRSPE